MALPSSPLAPSAGQSCGFWMTPSNEMYVELMILRIPSPPMGPGLGRWAIWPSPTTEPARSEENVSNKQMTHNHESCS